MHGAAYALSGAGLQTLMGAALARGASFRFTARGFSMDPFVRDGDVLTVGVAWRRPKVGDIVAVRSPVTGRLLVHRVVADVATGLLVRGDGAGQADGTFGPADVLGVVVGVERRGRVVRLGRGPERRAIALLSRDGWLRPLVAGGRRVAALLRRGGPV